MRGRSAGEPDTVLLYGDGSLGGGMDFSNGQPGSHSYCRGCFPGGGRASPGKAREEDVGGGDDYKDGVKVSVTSTSIGGPSAAVAVEAVRYLIGADIK